MSLLFEDLKCIGDVLLAQAGKAQPFRLEVDGEEKAEVVEKGGDRGGDQNLGIRDPMNSAMTNPTAPMIGGVNCPPVEATASTAAATPSYSRFSSSSES